MTEKLDDKNKHKSSNRVSGLWPVFSYVRPYRWALVATLASLVAAAGATLAIGQALRRMVDHGFSTDGEAYLDQYFLALLGVVALLAGASFARSYCVAWLGERVISDVRSAVYGHIVSLSPAFFELTRTGEVLSRLTTDTTLIQTVVGTGLSVALRNILLFCGGLVLLIVTSPKLAGLTLVIVPVVVVPLVLFGRRVRYLSRRNQDRVADMGAHAEQSINAIRTVQAFGRENLDRSQYTETVETAFRAATQHARARSYLVAVVILLVFGAVDGVLWIGAKDVISGSMSGGELAAFVFYAVIVAGSVGALSEIYGDIQRAAGAAERLFELLNTKTAVAIPKNPVPLPSPPYGRISFKQVTFQYPARPEKTVLSDFNLCVGEGERLALVGPSGSGKTTVFQLLMRYYDCGKGAVSFDDVDVKTTDLVDLRKRIALVPQEPVIFATDAMENIRYGDPEASDAEVKAAAHVAQALEFIEGFPDGFRTPLGERGVQLSGGQRQRIAIARAILCDPAVLLLDEATSALDAESESMVQETLETVMSGRTTIIIAHRLATVLKADRIVVVENGCIVASGKHDDLIAEDGLYARLAALQFDLGSLGESSNSRSTLS